MQLFLLVLSEFLHSTFVLLLNNPLYFPLHTWWFLFIQQRHKEGTLGHLYKHIWARTQNFSFLTDVLRSLPPFYFEDRVPLLPWIMVWIRLTSHFFFLIYMMRWLLKDGNAPTVLILTNGTTLSSKAELWESCETLPSPLPPTCSINHQAWWVFNSYNTFLTYRKSESII